MVTPEILAFVRGEQGKGVSRELITNILKTQGWTDEDIAEIFSSVPSLIPGAISTFSSPEPHKQKKLLFAIIAIIILVAGGAFFYASGYFTPLETVFSKSIQSTQNTTGVTFDTKVTIDASGVKDTKEALELVPGMSKIFNLNIKGSYDISNKDNIKSTGSISLESGTLDIGIDLRATDGMLYVNLTKAPELGFFSLKPFENKWVSFSYKTNELVHNPLASSLGVNDNPLSNLNYSQKKQILDITNNAKFIKITKKHLPEMVNGNLSFHFDFDLDKEALISYIKELTTYSKSLDKENQLPAINDSDIRKSLDVLKNFHGEAWVGMFNNLPQKSIVSFDFENPKNPGDGAIKVMASIIYKDWSQKLSVEVPKGATTLEKLMSEAMGGDSASVDKSSLPAHEAPDLETSIDPLSDARNKGVDAAMKSILSSMRAQAELYYDSTSNSYKGFCTSKGEWGAYKLAVGLPKNTVYKCNDNATSWASGVRLSVEGYWCVDSTGYSGSINSIPKDSKCPSPNYPTGLVPSTEEDLKGVPFVPENLDSIPPFGN